MSERLKRNLALAILAMSAALSVFGAMIHARYAAQDIDVRDSLRGPDLYATLRYSLRDPNEMTPR